MERLPRGNERNPFCCVSEDKEDNKGKRTPLVVTPALVEIILKVLLNVKEANVIVDALLRMRKDISRHAIIVSREGKKVTHFIPFFNAKQR